MCRTPQVSYSQAGPYVYCLTCPGGKSEPRLTVPKLSRVLPPPLLGRPPRQAPRAPSHVLGPRCVPLSSISLLQEGIVSWACGAWGVWQSTPNTSGCRAPPSLEEQVAAMATAEDPTLVLQVANQSLR